MKNRLTNCSAPCTTMHLQSLIVLGSISLTSLLFIIVTVSRPWSVYNEYTIGLWSFCSPSKCNVRYNTEGDVVFTAVKAFMILSILCEVTALVLAFVRILETVKHNLFIPILIPSTCGVISAIVGLSLFATKTSHPGRIFFLGWGSVLIGIISIMLLCVFGRTIDCNQEQMARQTIPL